MQSLARPVLASLAALALLSGVACSSRLESSARTPAPTESSSNSGAQSKATSTPAGNSGSSATQAPASTTTQASLQTGALSVADLVKLAEPAVVRIQTNVGVGTGFVVSDDGYVVTNNHVIASQSGRPSNNIEVTLDDGQVVTASVVGVDVPSDLAVLKLPVTDITPLKLGSLANTVVGEDVVAIGFALDLKGGEGPSFSVTRGIVSAKNRGIEENSTILGAIQTDAAITHGNSGGPLLNMQGEVVGVNTSLVPDADGGTAVGIGLAVGVDTVKAVYEEIRDKGSVDRALLGIRNFTAIRPAQARELGVPADIGGVLLDTTQGAAAAGGLRQGDVITKIGDIDIHTESELAVAMIKYDAGDTVPVEFYRGGQKQTTNVTLDSAS